MTKQQLKHIAGIVVTGLLGALTVYLKDSTWVYAPAALTVLSALATNVGKAFGGSPAVPPVAVFLLLALGLTGCKSLGPTPPPGTPSAANCADAALHQAELKILPSVENALASANWESALLSIVASVGGPLALEEVSCAVLLVESKADEAAPTTADSLEATKASHARAWLLKYPVSP